MTGKSQYFFRTRKKAQNSRRKPIVVVANFMVWKGLRWIVAHPIAVYLWVVGPMSTPKLVTPAEEM